MLIAQLKHLVSQELKREFRQKYALSGILLYVVSTVFVSYLSFKQVLAPATWNALFWVIMLFAAVNATSKSFIQETSGRMLYLYSLISPQALILSKIIYNALLMLCISVVCFIFYSLFVGSIVQDTALFLLVLFLGSMGFASILTLISAIAAKTSSNFALMAILSFPVIIPLLIVLVKVSKNAIDGLDWSVSYNGLIALTMLDFIVFLLSYLLFPYLWRD